MIQSIQTPALSVRCQVADIKQLLEAWVACVVPLNFCRRISDWPNHFPYACLHAKVLGEKFVAPIVSNSSGKRLWFEHIRSVTVAALHCYERLRNCNSVGRGFIGAWQLGLAAIADFTERMGSFTSNKLPREFEWVDPRTCRNLNPTPT